jgi:hypothetical protein
MIERTKQKPPWIASLNKLPSEMLPMEAANRRPAALLSVVAGSAMPDQ